MLFAVPLLGEPLDAVTLGFALAVIATVFVGKKTVRSPATRAVLSATARSTSLQPKEETT